MEAVEESKRQRGREEEVSEVQQRQPSRNGLGRVWLTGNFPSAVSRARRSVQVVR